MLPLSEKYSGALVFSLRSEVSLARVGSLSKCLLSTCCVADTVGTGTGATRPGTALALLGLQVQCWGSGGWRFEV